MSKAEKKDKIITFTTHLPPVDFKLNLREAVYDSGHLLYEDTPSGFDLVIERGGHSGGYWYVATVNETESGTEMRGRSSTAASTVTEAAVRQPNGRSSRKSFLLLWWVCFV